MFDLQCCSSLLLIVVSIILCLLPFLFIKILKKSQKNIFYKKG